MSKQTEPLTPTGLRAIRERWGLTQEQMAERIGVADGNHVSRMERGVRPITEPVARLIRMMDQQGAGPEP